jgi:hypothetical protein
MDAEEIKQAVKDALDSYTNHYWRDGGVTDWGYAILEEDNSAFYNVRIVAGRTWNMVQLIEWNHIKHETDNKDYKLHVWWCILKSLLNHGVKGVYISTVQMHRNFPALKEKGDFSINPLTVEEAKQ